MAEIPLRKQYHSVTFGEKNSWDDWHLVPMTRPVINPPSVKKVTVDVPGMDGVLDLSEVVSNRPVYGNRTGSIEFHVETDFTPSPGERYNDQQNWQYVFSTIMEYLHGKRMRMILEDDPEYYYEGRFEVNQWKSDKEYSLITIDYDVGPFRRKVSDNSKGGL